MRGTSDQPADHDEILEILKLIKDKYKPKINFLSVPISSSAASRDVIRAIKSAVDTRDNQEVTNAASVVILYCGEDGNHGKRLFDNIVDVAKGLTEGPVNNSGTRCKGS